MFDEQNTDAQNTDGKKNTGLTSVVIAGVIGLLGTALGSYMTSQSNIELKRLEFQSQLIMKAIEAKSAEERRRLLEFFINAELIETTDGLKKYIEPTDENGQILDPPQLRTSQRDPTRTDIDLWYCQGSETREIAQKQVATIHNKLSDAGFGQIRERIWTQYQEVSKQELKNKITIIVDNHEKGELPLIINVLDGFPLQIIDNRAESTAWRISIIVCPND